MEKGMFDVSKVSPNLFSIIVQRYIERVTGTKKADEWCYDYIDLFQKSKEILAQLDFKEVFKYVQKVESRFDRRFACKYLNEEGLKGLYLSHEIHCNCPLCTYVDENYSER